MKRTYYIAFQSSLTWKLWDVFTTKEYRHCWLFMDLGYESGSVLFEYRRGWMVMEDYVLSAADILEVLKTCPEQTTVLRMALDPWERKKYSPSGLITCVSIIKAVLGVTQFWIMTPRQLLLHLRSLGAETVLETHDGKASGTGRIANQVAEAASDIIEGERTGRETREVRP